MTPKTRTRKPLTDARIAASRRLSLAHAAAYCDQSRGTIKRRIRSGVLTGTRETVGGRDYWWIPTAEVELYAECRFDELRELQARQRAKTN